MIDTEELFPEIAAEAFIYWSTRQAVGPAAIIGRATTGQARIRIEALRISQERLQRAVLDKIAELTTADSIGFDLDDDSPIVLAELEERKAALRRLLP